MNRTKGLDLDEISVIDAIADLKDNLEDAIDILKDHPAHEFIRNAYELLFIVRSKTVMLPIRRDDKLMNVVGEMLLNRHNPDYVHKW